MAISFILHPVLLRFLAASAFCLALNIVLLELMIGGNRVQIHLAEGICLALSAGLMALAGKFLLLKKGEKFKTAKGQPVPFGALAVAGAVLNFLLFTRIIGLVPQPVDFFGRALSVSIGAFAAALCNAALIHSLLPQPKKEKRKPLIKSRTLAQILIWAMFVLLAFGSMQLSTQLQGIYSFPGLKAPLGPDNGPDTWLRLTQVRDWLSGAGFFDHTVRNTNAPIGGIETHWTRPMDMLVALLYHLMPGQPDLPPDLAMKVRLMLAAAWLPALMCLASVALLGRAAGRHFRHTQALGCIAILLLISVFRYTMPGDVDHHGLLAVLWCGILALLLSPRIFTLQAFGIGALLGLMLWVSQESILVIAIIFAVLGFEALLAPKKSAALFFAALGAAAVATGGLFAEIPAHEALTREVYDSLSIVQVALVWFTVAATGTMALLYRLPLKLPARFLAAMLCAALIVLGQYFLYPKFFMGPLVDADPFIFTGFLPRIIEAQALFTAKGGMILRILVPPALAAFLLGVALRQKDMRAEKKRFLILLAALLGITFLLTVYQLRWGYYMQAVAMVAVGALLPGMAVAARGDTGKWLKDVPRFMRAYLVLGCLYLCLSLLIRDPHTPTPRKLCNVQAHYLTQSQQLQKLLGDKSLVIYVWQDFGGEMQFFTPYRIIASNYHREGQGLKDIYAIEQAKTPAEALPLLKARKVDALLVCTGNYGDGWLHGLTPEKLPRFLKAVDGAKLLDLPGDKPLLLKVVK